MQPTTSNCKIEKGDAGLKRKRRSSYKIRSSEIICDDDVELDVDHNISPLQLPVTSKPTQNLLNPGSTKKATELSVPNTLTVNSSTAQADIMAGPKLATQDMKPYELLRRVGAFGGSMVKVIVAEGSESRTYILPKDLFCHQSEFFDKAFNGDFKGGEEQILKLPEEKPETFDFVCQWIYTGNVVLEPDNTIKDHKTRISHHITEYLDFVALANKLLLIHDPSSDAVAILEPLIGETKPSVLRRHIQTALSFRRGNPLRNLFASTHVRDYLEYYIRGNPDGEFDAELLQLEGFVVDLFTAVEAALKSKETINGVVHVMDPLTGGKFSW